MRIFALVNRIAKTVKVNDRCVYIQWQQSSITAHGQQNLAIYPKPSSSDTAPRPSKKTHVSRLAYEQIRTTVFDPKQNNRRGSCSLVAVVARCRLGRSVEAEGMHPNFARFGLISRGFLWRPKLVFSLFQARMLAALVNNKSFVSRTD